MPWVPCARGLFWQQVPALDGRGLQDCGLLLLLQLLLLLLQLLLLLLVLLLPLLWPTRVQGSMYCPEGLLWLGSWLQWSWETACQVWLLVQLPLCCPALVHP